MRIVGGKFKGRRLDLPKNYKARPTTDFAKENLFNILSNTIDWEATKALDLFGGTGSISIELVSRGCPEVTCIEKYPPNYTFIEKAKGILDINELKVFKMDVFKYLGFCKEEFDLIFADPPYDLPTLDKIPHIIFEKGILKEGGILIVEHSKGNNFDNLPFFKEKRVYGSVNFSIFARPESVAE